MFVTILTRGRDELIQGDEDHHTTSEGHGCRDEPLEIDQESPRQDRADRLSQP